MRFGYCCGIPAPGSDPREHFAAFARIGFDYVELPLASVMELEDGEFEARVLRPLESLGLPCRCCNVFFPGSIRLTGPEADLDAALRYSDRAMGRVNRLGAGKIVFGSGKARNYPLGYSREAAMRQIVQFLQALAPIAEAHGITVVLEHLNRGESNILTSLTEGDAVRRQLELSRIQTLADTYHLWLGGGSLDEIRKAGSHLRHVHVARTLGRALPEAGDECDWKGLFAVLREIGYDGDISIEASAPAQDRDLHLRESLAFLRTL